MAEDAVHNDHERLPLRNVVLCCTSLPQHVRTSIAETAAQLGAINELDLTRNCTHLIVGSVTTPKYRYVAKDRPEIKVLHPDFIEAVRQAWIDAEDIDLPALEEKHRLGTFFGLKICVTGFDDLDQRNYISRTAVQQGAEYHGDLTKMVTHLVAAAPSGAKYTAAKAWGLNIVSLKWFRNSMLRGMVLDETLYDPTMPVDLQGQGAFKQAVGPRDSLGKRLRGDNSQEPSESGPRKLRRTASTRLNSQSQDMWLDFSTSAATLPLKEHDQWKEEGVQPAATLSHPTPEPVQVRNSESFAGGAASRDDAEGLFTGRYFLIRGFPREKTTRLRQYLEPNGAVIMQSKNELDLASQNPSFKSRHLLVPHAIERHVVEPTELPEDTVPVTEWWLERCVYRKHYIDPNNDPLSMPLWDAKIEALVGDTICITGFDALDFRQVAEAIKLTGATYAENLTTQVTILVSGSDNVRKEKAYYAAKHAITVVSAAWFFQCLKTRRRVETNPYKISLPKHDDDLHRSAPSQASGEALQSKVDHDRKAKVQPKRLSSTRMRHATPALPLQRGAPASTEPQIKRAVFLEEDDSELAPIATEQSQPKSLQPILSQSRSPTRSRPLQELSPNASPSKPTRRGSNALSAAKSLLDCKEMKSDAEESKLAASPAASPLQQPSAPGQEPPTNTQRLTADLAALVEHQRTAARQHTADPDLPAKRKYRPLGRSMSATGDRSLSASAHSDHGTLSRPTTAVRESSNLAADGFTDFADEESAPTGTQLGYETPEARAHRLLMEKRMKVNLGDESLGRKAASIGVVKDSFAGSREVGSSATTVGGNRARRSRKG